MNPQKGKPLEFSGSPRERGRAQADLASDLRDQVRDAVYGRLEPALAVLAGQEISNWLRAQKDFAFSAARDEVEEVIGIAEGFELDFDDLFAYLHLGIIHDMLARPSASADGCTAWAASDGDHGAVVAKNRDFRGEHVALQRVFRHWDPTWGGRRILCVGSLGSPGAYSSGINSDGLAIADTQIGTTDHGVGLLRYFVMTRLLARARTVSQALEILSRIQHAGGGAIIMADARGDIAAVELGHKKISICSRKADWVARTNHFLSSALMPYHQASPGDPMAISSQGRLETVRAAIAKWSGKDLAAAGVLMSSHDGDDERGLIGLCRHGEDGDARTISTSLFTCRPSSLYFCPSNPCGGEWQTFTP